MRETKKIYRGGSSFVSKFNVGNALIDLFDTALYNKIKPKFAQAKKADIVFTNNEDFWKHISANKAFIDQNVILSNFYLTEWLPMSPGLFYTENAILNRTRAQKYLVRARSSQRERFDWSISNVAYFGERPDGNEQIRELDPQGKESMVLGGIGALRLLPKKFFDGERMFILGASSNGVCHEGLPVLLSSDLYNSCISEIKENCGLRCTLVGKLVILPTEDLPVRYDRNIAKYCLWIEDIRKEDECYEDEITVSVAITFSKNPLRINEKLWSFITFTPDRTDRHLIYSVEWLHDYAKRYSGVKDPFVLYDFDEFRQHFDKTEFSLKDVANGNIDFAQLAKYEDLLNIKIVNIMGDNFENISGTVINRSIVNNSLNKASEILDKESLDLLKFITDEVEKSGNRDAIDNMEEFHKELQKPEPKKSLLKSFWTGVSTAIPSLLSNADKVLDIIEKVGTVLPL